MGVFACLYIQMSQTKFTAIIISFEGCLIHAAFRAFTVHVYQGYPLSPCASPQNLWSGKKTILKWVEGTTHFCFPSSWGCQKEKCIYSEKVFEREGQAGRAEVTLCSMSPAKLIQIASQRKSQLKRPVLIYTTAALLCLWWERWLQW